jgi:release factor glutamine methyltransferase
MHSSIYTPEQDSYLLANAVKQFLNKIDNKGNLKVLEVGSGSGIIAETLINQGILQDNLTLTDINPEAIKLLTSKFPKANIIISNLFQNINHQKFNLIIFNPPYLPKDKENKEPVQSRVATTGGKKGSGIINKFLQQAKDLLKQDGKILLLTSSLTQDINWLDFKKKLIAEKKLFFEKLWVWEIQGS